MRACLPRLFNISREVQVDQRIYRSMLLIALSSTAGYMMSDAIPDPWWANRVLHLVGGGFTGALLCFLAAYESMPHMGALRFIATTALVVTALGVANEITEFILGHLTNSVHAFDRYDTEWDLISNSIGLCASMLIFAPFLRKK
ncbi:hypothetical protein HZC00_03215 [Candidatus Kaiserbacteria bacterium]|nr:hypothetical protein [Candidatus Kaiserbacteria bacterium]